jgi:hypothetical protein
MMALPDAFYCNLIKIFKEPTAHIPLSARSQTPLQLIIYTVRIFPFLYVQDRIQVLHCSMPRIRVKFGGKFTSTVDTYFSP